MDVCLCMCVCTRRRLYVCECMCRYEEVIQQGHEKDAVLLCRTDRSARKEERDVFLELTSRDRFASVPPDRTAPSLFHEHIQCPSASPSVSAVPQD